MRRLVRLLILGGFLLGCREGETGAEALQLLDFRQSGQAKVYLNEDLDFFFSADLDRTSITRASVSIKDDLGRPARGQFRVHGSKLTFEPELPKGPDLLDGGFRPGMGYRVALAGFPRVDGVRSREGGLLDTTLILSFRTASDEETLFLKPFPGTSALVLERPEIGPLDPIRLVYGEGLDPRSVAESRFELRSESGDPEGDAFGREIPVEVELAVNRPDQAVIELRPVSTVGPGGARLAIAPGDYYLSADPDGSLRTLGGQLALSPTRLPSLVIVRDLVGRLRYDFASIDHLKSAAPPDCDGTAIWARGKSGVRIRYPAAAGTGSEGNVALRRAGDPRPAANGGPACGFDGPARDVDLEPRASRNEEIDLHAVHLTIPEGARLDLTGHTGTVVLRAQGRFEVCGELVRRRSSLTPPGGATGATLEDRLEALGRLPADERPTLTAWLAELQRAGEECTVLIAGAELVVRSVIDVEGPLILVAGGWVRLFGSVSAGSTWRSSGSLGAVRSGPSKVLPVRLDPPETNPLRAPLRYAAVSDRIHVTVTSWGSTTIEGNAGRGTRSVRFTGYRRRGDRPEHFGPLETLSDLGDCPEIQFRVDLAVMPEPGAPWDPPILESLTLTWNAPASTN